MSYTTIRAAAAAEFTERKSRFIGNAAPVSTEEEALAFIGLVRSRYPDATHNVYAYNLQNARCRYSDDGEPQGTAGPPALDVLQKAGVVDVAVVVTRYFGGILLGAGGLVRAYSRAARDAIEAAGVCEVELCRELRFSVDYAAYGKAQYILPEYGASVLDTAFADDVTLTVRLKAARDEAFRTALLELTAGRCVPELVREVYGE